MNEITNDPRQIAVDAAVAAMVASNPAILTPAKSGEVAAAGAFGAASLDPSARLRTALAQRSALETAWATLRALERPNVDAIRAAGADAGAIVAAIQAQSLYDWTEANLGHLDTTAHVLNAAAQQEVVAAIHADAPAILASLAEHTDDPTTEYVRRIATDATTMDSFRFDIQGQPARPRVPILSALSTVVPR